MRIRTDAPFRKILGEARRFAVIQVERKGSAAAHPAVKKFIEFNAHFGVDNIAMFHRNLTALIDKAYHKGWIPHERVTLNHMQHDTNLFFSSGMGADAVRALEHMQRVQAAVAKMKAR